MAAASTGRLRFRCRPRTSSPGGIITSRRAGEVSEDIPSQELLELEGCGRQVVGSGAHECYVVRRPTRRPAPVGWTCTQF